MHLIITLCLLIVCGIVDALINDPRSQSVYQLVRRRSRSIGLPYPAGYQYNAIEPSIELLDSVSGSFDYGSPTNTYKPTYQHVKMSNRDAYSVPKLYSYHPKNPLYDSDYISMQDIPRLMPEDSYDYKYLASPWEKYRPRPSKPERDIDINTVSIKKTTVHGYGSPNYKSPCKSESMPNFDSLNTIFKDSQLEETNPEISKVSYPSILLVEVLPEALKKESTTITKNPFDLIFKELLMERQNAIKTSTNDESKNSITTENAPTVDISNSEETEERNSLEEKILYTFNHNLQVSQENIDSATGDESSFVKVEEDSTEVESSTVKVEETVTEDESSTVKVEEDSTEDESSSIKVEETATEDESSTVKVEEDSTEDESSSIKVEETATEDESSSVRVEETATEDESSTVKVEETATEDESSSVKVEETATEDESSSIKVEETATEDESSSVKVEETATEEGSSTVKVEEDSTEDESSSIKVEETATEDESSSVKVEETATEDESSTVKVEETATEDESSSVKVEETATEDESSSIKVEETATEDESSSVKVEETATEEGSNSIVTEISPTKDISIFYTEIINPSVKMVRHAMFNDNRMITVQTPTEDVLSSINTEETPTEDESNYTKPEENPTEDDHRTTQEARITFEPEDQSIDDLTFKSNLENFFGSIKEEFRSNEDIFEDKDIWG